MTLEDLRVLLAVARSRSLSQVARQAGCTQPAVSQRIARLERELGVSLIERGRTGITLTPAGATLRDAAADGLDAINAGIRRIAEIHEGSAGTLAITTGGTTVRYFLRSTIIAFRRRFPRVELQFVQASSTASCADILRRRQSELAFVTLGRPTEGLEHRPQARVGLQLLVPSRDPLARERSVKIAQLAGIRYIALSGETATQAHIDRQLAALDLRIEPVMTVGDLDTAGLFTELGLGCAIVPAVHAWHFSRAKRLKAVPIKGIEPLTVGWAARNWSFLPQIAHRFVELFAEKLEDLRVIEGLEVIGRE